jgi:hypothetical protein
MKSVRTILTALLICLVFWAPSVSAQFNPLDEVCEGVPATNTPGTPDNPDGGQTASTVCAEKENDENPISGPNGLLIRVARFISLLIGIAAVIIIIFGGIKYITSGGKPESVSSAKSTIVYALVGILIALLSQGIIVFVINQIE